MTFQPRNIVVPVAVGTGEDIAMAERLVDAACDIAAPTHGRLSLIFVNAQHATAMVADSGFAPPAYYNAMAQVWEANHTAATAALKALKARAEAKGVAVAAEIREPVEGTGEAIVAAARERAADLIVLWSHGRKGIKRLFLGSVAERVAHLATAPVLILHTSPA